MKRTRVIRRGGGGKSREEERGSERSEEKRDRRKKREGLDAEKRKSCIGGWKPGENKGWGSGSEKEGRRVLTQRQRS